ncbi:MAG: YncE family protein [Candidatus Micrarchaeota archaeon]|nr:YncE family protein [Candidatus Micrarchaeota archaeon]
MRSRLQAANEFISTYGFIILLVVLALALLITLGKAPSQVIPSECSIYGTMKCADIAYGTNAVGVTVLEILAVSQVQGIVNISSFNAVAGGIKSTSGYCTTTGVRGGSTAVQQGGELYCIAAFPNNAVLSQTYIGTFNMSGSYCPTAQAGCLSNMPKYHFSGSFRTVGAHNVALPSTSSTTILTTTSSLTSSSSTIATTSSSSSTTSTSTTSTTSTSTSTILCQNPFNHVYVADSQDTNKVIDINPATNAIANTITVPNAYFYPAISPDGRYLYVSGFNGYGTPGYLNIISTSNDVLLPNSIALGGTGASGAVVSQDGGLVYALSGTMVSAVNTLSLNVVNTIQIGASLGGFPALSPNGKTLYVPGSGAVYFVSTTSNTVTHTTSGISAPDGIAVSPDGNSIYVVNGQASSPSVYVISASTGNIIKNIPLGTILVTIDALSPDGSRLYVSGYGELYVISTSSYQVINSIAVSVPCSGSCHIVGNGVALSPDGRYAYMSEGTQLNVIDTAANSVVNTINIGSYWATGVAYASGC